MYGKVLKNTKINNEIQELVLWEKDHKLGISWNNLIKEKQNKNMRKRKEEVQKNLKLRKKFKDSLVCQ